MTHRALLSRAWAMCSVLVAALTPLPAASSHWDPDRVPKGMDEGDLRGDWCYAQMWVPFRLYVSPAAILIPESHADLIRLSARDGVITGLGSAASSSAAVCAVTSHEASRLIRVYIDALGERTRPVEIDGRLTVVIDRPTVQVASAKVTADAEALGEDLWFHDPIAPSPDGRWIVTAVSEGRTDVLASLRAGEQAPGPLADDIWLLDCAGTSPPRLMLQGMQLLACTWSPAARYAICEIESAGDGGRSVVLIDAETGSARVLEHGLRHAVWKGLGDELRVYGEGGVGEHDVQTGAVRSEARGGWTGPGDGAVWSSDGRLAAYTPQGTPQRGITIRSVDGQARCSPAAGGVTRILGWSQAAELLAYVTEEGELHLAVGLPAVAEYEAFVSTWPQMEGFPSYRETHGFETRQSPVKVERPGSVRGTWVSTPRGPCLLYSQLADDGPRMHAITFMRFSYSDSRYDVRALTRAEITESGTRANLAEVYRALVRYAADHDGRLPPSETGERLAAELDGYLLYRGALSSPYAQSEIRAKLLQPGQHLEALRAQARENPAEAVPGVDMFEVGPGDWGVETPASVIAQREQGIPLLQMESDNGRVYRLYLNSVAYHVKALEP